MDFKDKIIMCLVAMVVVLAILKMVVVLAILNSAHEQEPESEPEPANDIIYNVVDDDGHVIGGFILKK